MKILKHSLFVLVSACLVANSPAADKLKVLIVTGGHGFQRESFFKMFESFPNVSFTEAKQQKAAEAYERDDLLSYDALVLYDMPKTITDGQKARFLSVFEKGIGVVVLHHALVSYQHWPEYEQIIGGRYPEEDDKTGAVTDKVGYQHDVDIPIHIVAKDHPITRGLSDFTIHDEIYWGFRVQPDVTPLITTSDPKSGKPLAWYRTQGNSRIVYIQLGHGPEAYENPNYRKLVAQSIESVANNSEGGWISLFDGHTLNGWVPRGGKAEYRAANGEIIGRTVPNTQNSFLCTTRDFTNFILEVDFKVPEGLNSGVQIRSHSFDAPREIDWKGEKIKVAAKRVHGPQVEIDPSSRAWTGGLYGEGERKWLNDLKNNEPAQKAFKHRDWNHFRIECRGESIKTWLNGVPATDFTDPLEKSGFIALQVHAVGNRTEPLEVRFRNIRLKEL